jgi:hypothetical protein
MHMKLYSRSFTMANPQVFSAWLESSSRRMREPLDSSVPSHYAAANGTFPAS